MFIAIMYENGYHGPMLTDQGGKKASWQNCIYSSASFVLAKPVRINPALTSLKLKYSLPAPPKHFLRICPKPQAKLQSFGIKSPVPTQRICAQII